LSEPTHVPGEFAPQAKQAVYDAIALRRDIRSFRPDPVPDETLLRILAAAHRAGSVGFMQPWDFVVVRAAERRARIYDLFRRANDLAARHWRGDRAEKYLALKLQGVLDAPLGICVTCDTRRGGPNVLGRDSIRETDVYSTCLAVQNLWLAARAEGVGVGWVSIVDNDELAAELALPDGVIPVAFLCVGYPVEFPATPMLEATGWRDREELSRLVHFDGWGGAGDGDPLRALLGAAGAPAEPAPAPAAQTVGELAASVAEVDTDGPLAARVRARLDELTKPRGSMGRIEELAVRLAAIQERDFPAADRRAVLVFAGDHGVCEEGVSAYRPGVTARLCYNMVAGGGVVNALARRMGAEVRVVDVGVDHDFGAATGVVHAKVARGTRSLARHDAMTREQAEQAILAGMDAVHVLGRVDVIALGEVGMGNTTSAAALFALLAGATADEAVGRGTGVGDAAMARKAEAVRRAIERTGATDAVGKLAAAGGYEIAALAGTILAAAARRIPVVLDGFITGVAAMVAVELAPAARGHLIASHRSAEQAHTAVLDALGLAPLLDLDLRLGEGTGAVLALPLAEAACALLRDVRTFREAGIEEPVDPRGLT
jgi:nicotinate-nucleotide--dimethylbenzimidazole phosphoribosyltransferase